MPKQPVHFEDVLTDFIREEDLLEVPISNRAFFVFFVCVAVIAAVIFTQVLYLGTARYDSYRARALANASDTTVTPSPRGIIYDRFENALVRNDSSVNVFLVARKLPAEVSERNNVIQKASKILNVEEAALYKIIETANWNVRDKVLLSDDATQDQIVSLSSLSLPGIVIESAFRRAQVTPYAFAHVLGYTGLVGEADLEKNPALVPDDAIGRDGLEAFYDTFLRGKSGRDVVYRDARGEAKEARRVDLPETGAEVSTFLDKDFQEYFYGRLRDALAGLGRTTGAGIAIDPRNGEVLALVSFPSFKPEKIQSYLSEPTQPLFNRAISGVYNPGSTIKPLVGLAALTEGVVTTQKEILSKGYIDIPNPYHPESPSRFVDWKPHGWVNLYSALARSSNIYFYSVGGGFEDQKGLGISRLNEWWTKFGLNATTGIDLAGEKSGFLPTPSWKEQRTGEPWRLGDTYNVSIGQGDLMVTPVELLNYIAAIANGGKRWKLRIMDSIRDSKGKELAKNNPVTIGELSEEEKKAIPEIRHGMEDAVRKPYGTANLLANLPFEAAAKTGTAQIHFNEKTNAFFVGYAPAQNPRIAILVLVENSLEGSHNTIPVARDVLLWYYENRIKKSN